MAKEKTVLVRIIFGTEAKDQPAYRLKRAKMALRSFGGMSPQSSDGLGITHTLRLLATDPQRMGVLRPFTVANQRIGGLRQLLSGQKLSAR
jgi:hypothetical protein